MRPQFNLLYEAAIDSAERAQLAAKRIANITEHLTYSIYAHIQRGLFERHKLIFAWMLAVAVLTSAGKARLALHFMCVVRASAAAACMHQNSPQSSGRCCMVVMGALSGCQHQKAGERGSCPAAQWSP
jgi:hypothetical protein